MKIKIACATDDRINLSKEHFGSAKEYLIYEWDLDSEQIKFLERRLNTSAEEETHGDPKKARKVADFMEGISILLNAAFGRNITRMRKRFIPVVSREKGIEEALKILSTRHQTVKENLAKEPLKDIIYLA